MYAPIVHARRVQILTLQSTMILNARQNKSGKNCKKMCMASGNQRMPYFVKGMNIMREKPFIHCFRTYNCCYFYDFNTNAIIRVPESVYVHLREVEKGVLKRDADCYVQDILDDLRSQGFLSTHHWSKIEHPATELLDNYLESSIQSLTIQITQQCNLKCEYCPYSGSFYNRQHNNRKMSFEIAKKAIDFYFLHSFDIPNAQIGFYGGEPLIEFELLKKVVEYCNSEYFGKQIRYFITTNATLLTEDKLDFLMKNNFVLTISLDGPKQYHNKNRHKIDDTGSFDTVMDNIRKVYHKYPDKKENVQFNCVIDPDADLKCISDFFIKEDALKEYRVLFNAISRVGIKEDDKFLPGDSYFEQYEYEVFKMMYSKYGKVKGIDVSNIVETYFWQIKNTYRDRKITGLYEEYSHPSGPCVPGVHKLFVDVMGNFYPCEKVCEESKDMVIGNVESGFDEHQVDKLLNIGKMTEEQCKNCWCAKYCFVCAVHLEQEKTGNAVKKLEHCVKARGSVENDFIDYCTLQEIDGFDEEIMIL